MNARVPIGPVPGVVALHLRITELLVHSWDLDDLPPGQRPFAPPQPVPETAPAIDRLAACLGRSATTPAIDDA